MKKESKKTYFFCGIGGMGMSALAQVLVARGHKVAGSDRSYDMGEVPAKFNTLKALGIALYPQDGSGIAASGADVFVVSTAVEDDVPDVIAAKGKNLQFLHRSELLAELVHTKTLLSVGGTSGKSTTVGMLGHILKEVGKNPTVINGALMCGAGSNALGNVVLGGDELSVAEVDESDASIQNFNPQVAVLLNVTLDHKSLEELRKLFGEYVSKATEGVVLNKACAESMALKARVKSPLKTFALQDQTADFFATDVTPTSDGITFKLNGMHFVALQVMGAHNVENALAAIAAAALVGVPVEKAAHALKSFKGMQRRLEVLGEVDGVSVIDDFAHNPHKIKASLKALHAHAKRLFVVYQPHGFGPAKTFRKELVQAFTEGVRQEDQIWMPEIYFVGGTADKTISSADLVADLKQKGVKAKYFEKRSFIPAALLLEVKPGDMVVVMGARDVTLTDFALKTLAAFKSPQKESA